jgi:hypothetical protein
VVVDDFVAAKALSFNKVQQSSTRRPQTVLQQSLRNNKNPQISIRFGIWFGTRGSEVQILSPFYNPLKFSNFTLLPFHPLEPVPVAKVVTTSREI